MTINPGGTSTGMFLSNVCAEGISLVDIDEVEDDAADVSSYAATQAVSLAKIVEQCAVWDVEAAPDAAFEPVSTDVPTLIVTGAFDPITPTSYGEAVEEDLSEATLVEVSAAGHDPLTTTPEPECGQMILVEFLTDPSAEVDDGCATEATPVFGPMAEALQALIGSQQPQGGG